MPTSTNVVSLDDRRKAHTPASLERWIRSIEHRIYGEIGSRSRPVTERDFRASLHRSDR